MPLSRHLETVRKHIAQGNRQSAENLVATLLRQYSRKSDQAKILSSLES